VLVPLQEFEVADTVLDKSEQYTVLGKLRLTGDQPSGFTLSEIVWPATGEPPEPANRGLF
jgi:hypothetical protein